MQTSMNGLISIARDEGIVPAPYLDKVNVWTFGIGHTANGGPPDPSNMQRGMPDDVDAAIRQAVRLFQDRLGAYEDAVRRAVTIGLRQHEFDALVSFQFNTGGIDESSGTPRLNSGDKAGAWAIYQQWNKGTVAGRKVVLDNLVGRRADERRTFFTASYKDTPVPVYRVSKNHRPIIRSPIDRLSVADMRELLETSGQGFMQPNVPRVAPPPRSGLFSRLLGRPRPSKPNPQIYGRTDNDLPIYVNAADYPDWRWRNFSPSEMACKGTGRLALDPAAMDKLQALRNRIGKPFNVNSAYRSPEHNAAVGGAPGSKHKLGIAFDISMRSGIDRAQFKREAERLGFTGIGDYPSFIHIDTRPGGKARW